MIAGDLVAIDGSKFQAVASARRHLNLNQLKRQDERLDTISSARSVSLGAKQMMQLMG
ncbi:IS4 family transposase [Pseudomonas putida S11]|nr:IS4 family transposase [Pseudomonas putida S11]